MRRTSSLFVLCTFACACGSHPSARHAEVPSTGTGGEDETARRFAEWEQERLHELSAVDPRISQRLRIAPTEEESRHAALGAILAEDKGLRVVDGRADIFSFDGRARELDAIASRVAAPPRGPTSGDEGSFEAEEEGLLSRFLAEERARVDEERRLPSSGSALLRGVVSTWTAPTEVTSLHARDAWLSGRLDEIRDALRDAPLRAVEITDLEDEIDPIERLANPEGFPKAAAAIARLRLALGAERPPPSRRPGWAALREGLRVHLGIRDSEAELRADVARMEVQLRSEAAERLSRLAENEAKAVRTAAAETVLANGDCGTEATRSPLRTAAPPPERAPVCGALEAIARADSEADALAALLSVHDAIAVARWALAIQLDDRDPSQAMQGSPLLADVPPERVEKFIRFAATRPLECLAVARMGSLLDRHGPANRRGRAKRWLAFGDAPLDVVATVLERE